VCGCWRGSDEPPFTKARVSMSAVGSLIKVLSAPRLPKGFLSLSNSNVTLEVVLLVFDPSLLIGIDNCIFNKLN